MIVFSVHERPIFVHMGVVYHPYSNVITKYFSLADNILYGCSGFEEISEEKSKKLERIENPNIEFITLGRINSLKSMLTFAINNKVLKKNIKRADIIIARLPSFTGLHAVRLAKKYNKPYMVEVIGCAWDAYWNYGLKGKMIAPWFYILNRLAIKKATHAVYVTEKFLQSRYPTIGKSISASNVCIHKQDNDVLGERIKFINNKKNNTISLATAAGINNPVKGQQYVIKALSELNNGDTKYHYYLLGGGDPTFLRSIAHKYKVEEYVHFLGQIGQSEVIKFLHNIDIYIQPSKQEGLPRALIEAMSQACPAIGSKVAGIPELLNEKYLFRKGKVSEIIKLIEYFSTDEMVKQAHLNYETAIKYQFDIISKRRKDFFYEFKKDYNLI